MSEFTKNQSPSYQNKLIMMSNGISMDNMVFRSRAGKSDTRSELSFRWFLKSTPDVVTFVAQAPGNRLGARDKSWLAINQWVEAKGTRFKPQCATALYWWQLGQQHERRGQVTARKGD